MKYILLVFISLLTFGCTSLTKDAEKVKIADTAELEKIKKECKEVGPIIGSGEAGDERTGLWKATVVLKNTAAEKMANVVVSKLQVQSSVGWMAEAYSVKGIAFSCPQNIYDSLTNAESM